MVILRRTNRLRSQIPDSPQPAGESDTVLGDWYVNRVVIQRMPLLLIISSRSLLPIVTRARDVRSLPARLPDLVGDRLRKLGVPPVVIEAEVERMNPVVVRPTADRSVVGILVEYAYLLEGYLERGVHGPDMLQAAEQELEGTPCLTSLTGNRTLWPRTKALELLAT
jgi:hypothetical protein